MTQAPALLLERTLAEAVRDSQTATPEGKPIRTLTEGLSIHDLPMHIDARGSVTELFDTRTAVFPDPLVFVYSFTIRPGYVKGWNLHKEHEDRYIVLQGEMDIVLFDPRPDSSTCGQLCRIALSGGRRQIVNISKFVWHADHNIGTQDVVAINLPTAPYDHAAPDKYRLPIDTPLIPYSFGGARGW